MWLLIGLGFLFGLFAGSFWHVCMHRLPRAESIVQPGSRCYACGTPLSGRDNIPLLGWLLNKGACRHCGARIPFRYLWVEIVAGLLVAATVGWVMWSLQTERGPFVVSPIVQVGVGLEIAAAMAVAVFVAWIGTLFIATVIDFQWLIIPDEILLGWLLLGPLLGTLVGTPLLGLHFDVLPSPQSLGWLSQGVESGQVHVHLAAIVQSFVWPVVGLAFLAGLWFIGHRVFSRFVDQWDAKDNVAMWKTQGLFSMGVLLALMVALAAAASGDLTAVFWSYAVYQSVWGAICGWGALAVISVVGTAAFRRYAMGLGDVKLLAPMGALLGPIGVLMVFGVAVIVASFLGIIHLLRGGGRELPFGPSLALAGLVVMVFGPEMLFFLLGRLS